MLRTSALVLVLTITRCGHRVQVQSPPPVPEKPPEHAVLYREGLAAFRLATPEGYQRAADAFRKASALNASSCEYAVRLAEALVFLAREEKLNSDEFEPQLSEAGAVLDTRQSEPACASFESATNRVRGLALYLREPIRRQEAVVLINKAIELDPNDPLNWIALSRVTTRDPRNPLQHAIDLAPDLALVQYEFGTSLLYVPGGFPNARAAFDRTLELSPRHFQSLIGKVYSFSEDEYSEQTEPLLKQAVNIAPRYLTGRRLLGEYYEGMEETEKAVEQFQAAIDSNPKYYPAFLGLGQTLISAERYDEAEQALLRLVELDVITPRPPLNAIDYTADCQAHSFLGNIWFQRGDPAKAKAEYMKALRDIPNFPDALYAMGLIFVREGSLDDALARFNQVIREHPDDFPGAYVARAGIRFGRRQFADAISDYESAVTIFRKQMDALEAKAQMDESKGLLRRAFAQRRRKTSLEAELERAIQSKKTTESELTN
jgi:tetratricopeptide (TPR) repeat protein